MTQAVASGSSVYTPLPTLRKAAPVMPMIAAKPDHLELDRLDSGQVAAKPVLKAPGGHWEIMPLPELPKVGEPLRLPDAHALGRILTELVATSKTGVPSSDWSNPEDLRLVLPVVKRKEGPLEVAYEMLPGREDERVTLKVKGKPADPRLNGDGWQGGVRLGAKRPVNLLPTSGALTNGMAFQSMAVEWAEFRLGVEGLVFTGRLHAGSFEITQFDLEQGYFQAKLEGMGEWAKKNLAIAIPLGIVGAGVAAVSLQQAAKLTGNEIALPLGATVYKKDGLSFRPSVRTLFGPDGGVRFGGAEVGVTYSVSDKAAIQLLPRYNQDPQAGKTGLSVGGRVTFAIPHGLAGAEVRVDTDGAVSAFAGVGGVF